MRTECTIYKTADFIGRRWTLLILLELYRDGSKRKRYSHIKKAIPGITPKMLAARLRELEKEGMIEKNVDASSFPIKSEYHLTKSGLAFISVIKAIKKWALEFKTKDAFCNTNDCSSCTL